MENENKKHLFLKGSLTGIVATILVVAIVFGTLWKSGIVNVGTNGEIYVQDTAVDSSSTDGIGNKVYAKLNALEKVLSTFYFDDADETTIADNIYKAYLNSFGDKYTVYYTAEEYQSITQTTQGTYCGIGVVVSKNDDGTIRVVYPYKNCPGSEAGMQIGDSITKVNGESVVDRDLTAVVADMKGEAGTSVQIELVREGVDQPIVVDVERRKIEIPTVDSKMMDNNIGYIQISEFDEVTTSQFKDAYHELQSQGMQGLVVDVRSNPGGLLTTVIDILDEILPDGMIVYTEDKDGKRTEYKGKNSNEINVPMAVLVNQDSASAAEIFAGGVQDYGVGKLVGTTTFGKGIVQTIRPLTDGSAIKFTTAKYFTAKGQDIHGKGLTPDIRVELSDDIKNKTNVTEADDNQLQAAIQSVMTQISNK